MACYWPLNCRVSWRLRYNFLLLKLTLLMYSCGAADTYQVDGGHLITKKAYWNQENTLFFCFFLIINVEYGFCSWTKQIWSLSTLSVAKSPEALRDMLKTTMKYENKPRLETLVSEVEEARYPELFTQLHEARAFLDMLEDEGQG